MGYSILSLVRFGQLLDHMKNTMFKNELFEIIANFRMKYLFFSQASYTKNSFCTTIFILLVVWDINLVRFEQLLDPTKKTYF